LPGLIRLLQETGIGWVHPSTVAACVNRYELRFDVLVQPIQHDITQNGAAYTSYKVANLPIEFSRSIPRAQLRPGYGDGFRGAPLEDRGIE